MKLMEKLVKKIETESDFQRFEWLGDSVFGLIVTEYIFKRFKTREGFMSILRTKIINNNILKTFCLDLGWGQFNTKQKNMADLFESIVGVYFYKYGYKKTYTFIVKNLLESKVKWTEILITLK